jgi:glycerophosphoryl diester phosphodiesterase
MIITGAVLTMSAQNDKTKVTAHRGASGHAPENTLSSMQEAINMKADFSEIDVQETADGELILLHDGSLKRTTGLDKGIWKTNYDEVKMLDAGSWFGEKFKGEKIPTLAEVIDSVKGKMRLNIELKTNKHEKKLADLAAQVVKDKNFEKECVFTSFAYSQIKRVKEIDKNLKVGLIFSNMPEDFDVFAADMDLLSVHYKLVDADFVKKAKANGKEVHVWTVNDEAEMNRLIDIGVTSIITNYPDKLNAVLAGR